VQPDDNVGTSVKYGKQWFNYTDSVDVTYDGSAYAVEEAVGANGGLIAPGATELDTLAGGMPGVAPGGANRVFIPTSFEGGANPVASAKIQLNGHDRFAEMDGRYFNLVQPFQHHENVPSRGINVYSFGLKPEEHQPSGTCNMSRIDSATLNLTLTSNTVAAGGSAKVRVFAVNYNVLRIMSGINPSAEESVFIWLVIDYSIATHSNCRKTLRYPLKNLKSSGFEQSAANVPMSNMVSSCGMGSRDYMDVGFRSLTNFIKA
jgi:hypothetical protein